MTKVFTIAHVSQELEQAWLQHLRDFDAAHPGCHFEVMVEGPDRSLHEMMDMLRINPALSVTDVWKRGS